MNWKHIIHILRKDFRAQRFHLILWGLLLVLYVGVLSRWEPGQPRTGSVMTMLANLLPAIVIVYGLALLVALIHHDPVAGTSAFWLTRPVRGASLLVAKALEAAAMAALWLCADFLVLAVNGVADHAGYLAFDSVTNLVPVALIACAIAAMVPNMPRFLLTVVLVLVGYSVLASAINMVSGWFIVPQTDTGSFRTPGERLSAHLVGVSIAAFGAVAILAWQFTTRRTALSIVVALIAAIGAAFAFSGWSHDFIGHRASQSEEFDSVELEINTSELRPSSLSQSVDDAPPVEYRTVSGKVSVHGLPDGVFADSRSTQFRAITPGGREFLQHPYNAESHQRLGGISAALGDPTLAGLTDGEWWSALVCTGQGEYEQFAHQPCTVEGEIQLDLSRYELLGELSLERGAEGRFDGLQVRITDVDARPDFRMAAAAGATDQESGPSPYECVINLSEKYPSSRLKAVLEGGKNGHLHSDLTFVLINRQKNEALRTNGGGSSSFGGLRMLFRFNERTLKFHPADGSQRSARYDQEWFAGASLAILKLCPLGQITRTLSIENIVLDPKQG